MSLCHKQWAAVCLLLVGTILAAPVSAQGEHSRRVAAEIRVALGDLRRLQTEALTPEHKAGLHDRIAGALAGLDILQRLADQEMRRPVKVPRQIVAISTWEQGAGDLDQLGTDLAELASLYPLSLPAIQFGALPAELTPFQSLHRQHCATCHDLPAINTKRPAYNLFQMAISLPEVEFFARMLVGVRGDSVMGIDNPLSDTDIMGLTKYYSSNTNP